MCIAGLCLPVIYWIAILIMLLVVIADPIGVLKGLFMAIWTFFMLIVLPLLLLYACVT